MTVDLQKTSFWYETFFLFHSMFSFGFVLWYFNSQCVDMDFSLACCGFVHMDLIFSGSFCLIAGAVFLFFLISLKSSHNLDISERKSWNRNSTMAMSKAERGMEQMPERQSPLQNRFVLWQGKIYEKDSFNFRCIGIGRGCAFCAGIQSFFIGARRA